MKKIQNEEEEELFGIILGELIQYRAKEICIVYWIDGFGWLYTPLLQICDFREECPHVCFKKELIEDVKTEFEIRRRFIS